MSKSKRIVLLGAGASVEAGVPAAVSLTEVLINNFRLRSRAGQVLRYVYGGLMLGKGARGEDPLKGVNIEDLIEAINQLANRSRLQIAPFIALWNEGVSSFEEEDAREGLTKVLKEVVEMTKKPVQGSDFALKKSSLNYALRSLSQQSARDFLFTKEGVIKELLHLLWLEDASKVDYFKPLIQLGEKGPFTVATLNYDNTIELACETEGMPCTTGLESWNRFEGFKAPEIGIELLKLHGSVSWEKINRRQVFNKDIPMPRLQIEERARADLHRSYEPAIIFGKGNKLTAKGPFLELLLAFRHRLNECEELIVIGYSFADEHINDAIWRWLNRGRHRTLKVIDYSTNKEATAFSNMFYHLDNRYSFSLDGAGAGIVEVFG